MNWDTNELDTWIMNDEGLYNVALELFDRSNGEVTESEAMDELLPLVCEHPLIDVDINRIDWDEIADSINEMHS